MSELEKRAIKLRQRLQKNGVEVEAMKPELRETWLRRLGQQIDLDEAITHVSRLDQLSGVTANRRKWYKAGGELRSVIKKIV